MLDSSLRWSWNAIGPLSYIVNSIIVIIILSIIIISSSSSSSIIIIIIIISSSSNIITEQVNVTEGETVMSCMEKLLQRRGFPPSNFQVLIIIDHDNDQSSC